MEPILDKIESIRTDIQVLISDMEALEPEEGKEADVQEAIDSLHGADSDLEDAISVLRGDSED